MLKKIKNIINKNDTLDLIIGLYISLYLLSFILYNFGLFRFEWVALPYSIDNFLQKIWTILTYGFFHNQLVYLIFNMILLFYFGRIFLEFFNQKKFFKIFIGGIIIGGFFFILSYGIFPDLFINKGKLLGGSAGIMAILTYISTNFPNYKLIIRFIGGIKLIYILIFFLIFNLLQIPLGNPGGYFAHLGGLTAGLILFIFDKYIYKFKKSQFSVKDESIGKNYKINKILEKINRSGYKSLTEEEKEFLFRQGKN